MPPLIVKIVNSTDKEITIEARVDFSLMKEARISLGTTVAQGQLDLRAVQGAKQDFIVVPAKGDILLAGFFRNPIRYRRYLEDGDTEIELRIYKTPRGFIWNNQAFRFDRSWLEKYRLDISTE